MVWQILPLITARVFLLSIVDPVVENALIAELCIALGGAGIALLMRHWLQGARLVAASVLVTLAGGVAWMSATQAARAFAWKQECPECIDRYPQSWDFAWAGEVLTRSSIDALIGALAVVAIVMIVERARPLRAATA